MFLQANYPIPKKGVASKLLGLVLSFGQQTVTVISKSFILFSLLMEFLFKKKKSISKNLR